MNLEAIGYSRLPPVRKWDCCESHRGYAGLVCRNANHPKPGDTIKVEPIRSLDSIDRIKQILFRKPRDYALFVVGINTAYRASELLSIRVGQVRHLRPGDRLEIKQRKTKKYRAVTINGACYHAFKLLLADLEFRDGRHWQNDSAFLFAGRLPDRPLLVSTVNNLVKYWCRTAGLNGNYGSHTLRKTWGYMQRTQQDTAVPLLMTAFGHATQQQTLAYLCIQDEEIKSIYTSLEL